MVQGSSSNESVNSAAPRSSHGREMVRVAATGDLTDGRLVLVRARHAPVAIVRMGDEIRAVAAICTHARIFLAPGRLCSEGLIECPSHGAKFSPVDGSVKCTPATVPLAVYEVKVIDGEVYVDPGDPPPETQESPSKPGARASSAQWGKWA
jgi:nitrite reductase/ring-hydroxylating ferredoxin subunit